MNMNIPVRNALYMMTREIHDKRKPVSPEEIEWYRCGRLSLATDLLSLMDFWEEQEAKDEANVPA